MFKYAVTLIISVSTAGPAFAENAPQKLSATGLYGDLPSKTLNAGVRRFNPQYPLWTDGAQKSRWIYLPPGTRIDSKDQDHWTFPVGTKLWKEFSFGEKRVETRLLEKKSDGSWIMVTYLWDEKDEDAVLADSAGKINYYPTPYDTLHDIPSFNQCQSCHRRGGDPILGFDPLQLSDDRDSRSPHQTPITGEDLTLNKLVEENLLTDVPAAWSVKAPSILASSDSARAAMGYLHGNCGHCHNSSGKAGFTGQFLRHSMSAKSEADEPAFATTVNKLTRMFNIPGQRKTYRIRSGDPDHSAIPYRMDRRDGDQMPPIDTKVVDREAIDLLREWISEL